MIPAGAPRSMKMGEGEPRDDAQFGLRGESGHLLALPKPHFQGKGGLITPDARAT